MTPSVKSSSKSLSILRLGVVSTNAAGLSIWRFLVVKLVSEFVSNSNISQVFGKPAAIVSVWSHGIFVSCVPPAPLDPGINVTTVWSD